jgi:hypothetical protein
MVTETEKAMASFPHKMGAGEETTELFRCTLAHTLAGEGAMICDDNIDGEAEGRESDEVIDLDLSAAAISICSFLEAISICFFYSLKAVVYDQSDQQHRWKQKRKSPDQH